MFKLITQHKALKHTRAVTYITVYTYISVCTYIKNKHKNKRHPGVNGMYLLKELYLSLSHS